MLDHDKQHWKIPRFIKDEKAYEKVNATFLVNLRKLFYIYITLSASSNFPGIAWLSFAKFTEKLKITQDG